MDLGIGIAIVLVGFALFMLGAHYGSGVEREIVAKALAEYGKLSAEATGLVQSVLSRLDSEYSKIYDEFVAEYDKIKKAL